MGDVWGEEGEGKDEVYLFQWRLRSERAVEVELGVELVGWFKQGRRIAYNLDVAGHDVGHL